MFCDHLLIFNIRTGMAMGKFRTWGTGLLLAASFAASASAGMVGGPGGYNPPDTRIPLSEADYYFQQGPLAPYSAEPVDVRLLLIFDASSSMSDNEYAVQIEGAANALTSEQVLNSWFGYPADRQSGPIDSVAIGVIVFDSFGRMRVPWVDFRNDDPNLEQRFALFADEVRGLVSTRETTENRATAIAESFRLATQMFKHAPWESIDRDVIDVSGDGHESGSRVTLEDMKADLASMNVTINALAIINEEEDLEQTFRDEVITRIDEPTNAMPGNVWVVARNLSGDDNGAPTYFYFQEQFERALREKLVREVAGLSSFDDNFATSCSSESVLTRTANYGLD